MNNADVILSIIVPVYNVENYLDECLQSLIEQNIPKNEYEIICIDDGSTDKSGEICDYYAKEYENIMVEHKTNKGVSCARNRGIDLACGKYLWFVDSDDFIRKNVLKDIVNLLRVSNCDQLSVLPYQFIDGQKTADECMNDATPQMSQMEIRSYLWCKIMKRSIITEGSIKFKKELTYAEDSLFDFQVRQFLLSTNSYYDEVVYFYRYRKNSLMSQSTESKVISRIAIAEYYKGVINNKSGDIFTAKKRLYFCVSDAMRKTASMPKEIRKKIYAEIRKKNLFPLRFTSKYTPKRTKKLFPVKMNLVQCVSNYSYTRVGYATLVFLFGIQRLFHNKSSCEKDD